MMSNNKESERLSQLVLMAWGILFGIFTVVLFGVLFVIHIQLDRIERNSLTDDAFRSTLQALEAME